VRTRVKSCRRRTVEAPSSAARSMIASSARISLLRVRPLSSCARPRIAPSTLLKSWATPDAISPSARSFSERTSPSWASLSWMYESCSRENSSAFLSATPTW
jgi:hypothetical protein